MENKSESFWLKSYQLHVDHEKSQDCERLQTWKQFNTVDAWRHKRMYDAVLPVLLSYPDASWLTVGDGRYGTDANFLIRNNAKEVMATSISDELLKQAYADGFISNYKVENAEDLSFAENSFDFVFCKESYHHFPRPMVAFYEMLRVARNAVIVIEPNDVNIITIKDVKTLIKPPNKWKLIKNFSKDFMGIKRFTYNTYNPGGYETLGNYIYSTSQREFEKAALGLNLPLIAFKGINDHYENGVEFEQASADSLLFTKIKNAIATADAFCEKNGRPYNILVSIIFKVSPNEAVLRQLAAIGFILENLPRNPYV